MAHYQLCYGRVSSKDQNLDLQIQQFQQQVEFDELFTESLSGRRRDRPEFLRLVDRALELRQHRHQVTVWVVEWTRWARDTVWAMESLAQLEAAGVQVKELTTGQEITLQTASGLLTTGVKSLMAHYYSEELSARLKRANVQLRRQGRPMGGLPPFGYQRSADNSCYEPGPDWGTAREAVDYYLEHGNLLQLTHMMQDRYGIGRNRTVWRAWLKNPTLRGHLHYRKTNEWRYNAHPALISEDEYKRIEYWIDLNRQLRGNNQGRIHAVPPIVSCSCGCRCRPNSRGKNRYFICAANGGGYPTRPRCPQTRSCRQDMIEAAIQEALIDHAQAIAHSLKSDTAFDPAIAALEQELAALKPLAHRSAIAEEIAAIEADILARRSSQGQVLASSQRLQQQAIDAASMDWSTLDAPERRQLYADLVERVIIQGNEVLEVRFKR
jgi:DNA invertase Pin-like site-specific DNA recombinase